MLLGHWIEMNAVSNASNALQKLAELLPESVRTLDERRKRRDSLTKRSKGRRSFDRPFR